MQTPNRHLLPPLLALLAACGGPENVGDTEDEIIGGRPATDPFYDAIGAIGWGDTTSFEFICTATLISPTAIITARHCAIAEEMVPGKQATLVERQGLFFAVGPDSRTPTKVVRIAAAAYSEPAVVGWLGGPREFGLGHDVAVMTLAEPIRNVRPIPVSAIPPRAGQRVENVGFGVRSLATGAAGVRRRLAMNIDTLTGAPGELAYLDFASYVARIKELAMDQVMARQTPDRLRRDFTRPMGPFEMYAGKDAFHAGGNSCFGDSGGPLLDLSDPAYPTIVGLTSGGVGCEHGGVYARVDQPRAQSLLSNDPCAHIPATGLCSSDRVITCNRSTAVPTVRVRACESTCDYDANNRAVCAPEFTADAPSCHRRPILDRPVVPAQVIGRLPPAPQGGTPRDGTWVMTDHTFFDKEGDAFDGLLGIILSLGIVERSTLYVRAGTIQVANASDSFLTPLSVRGTNPTFVVETSAATGAVLRLTCPVHDALEVGLTATDDRIEIYEYRGGNLVSRVRFARATDEVIFDDSLIPFSVAPAVGAALDARTLENIRTPEALGALVRKQTDLFAPHGI